MNIDSNLVIQSLISARHSSQWKVDRLVPMVSGRDNLVYIDSTRSYIVKVYLVKSLQDVQQEYKLIRYLCSQGFPTSTAIDSGRLTINGHIYPFLVFKYVVHDEIDLRKAQPLTRIGSVADALAKLHELTSNYPRPYSQSRTLHSDIDKLLTRVSTGKSTAINRAELVQDLEWALKFVGQFKGEDCIIHNDFRANNLLFHKGEVAAVIDFEWAIASPSRLKDVGHAALEWSFLDGAHMDWTKYKSFIQAYEKASHAKINSQLIIQWSMFAALADAAYYFLCYPSRTTEQFNSFMYDKFKILKNNVA